MSLNNEEWISFERELNQNIKKLVENSSGMKIESKQNLERYSLQIIKQVSLLPFNLTF